MDIDLYFNENDIYISNQIKNGIIHLIFSIRNNFNRSEYRYIIQMMYLCGWENKTDIAKYMIEDGFIKWSIAIVKKNLESNFFIDRDRHFDNYCIFEFLVAGTDTSSTFCESLSKEEDFIFISKYLINSDDSIVEPTKEQLVLIINNICYNFDSLYLNDLDLKVFLLQRAENPDEKLCCIFTLLRIMSREEIEPFANEVCSILENYQELFIHAFENLHNYLLFEESKIFISLEEILSNLKPLSKCDKAKEILSKNEKFKERFKTIFTNQQYFRFRQILSECLPFIYSIDELSQFYEEID